MARMHSRKKGDSGSTKPVKKSTPTWVRHKPREVEMLISKFAKEGISASEIGLQLRDVYGIPDSKLITGKSITKVIEEKNLSKSLPEDMLALIKRIVTLNKHVEENHKDQTAKRGLTLTTSKIRRLVKYYKSSGKLSADWNFNPQNARMYLE